ncbi:MAG: aminopeptidase [Gemmatimonadales bacterium]
MDKRTGRRLFRIAAILVGIVLAVYVLAWLAFADVRYVTRAAIAEAGILSRRRSIAAVVDDRSTDPRVRSKLLVVLAARDFAKDSLGLAAGETFTTYSALPSDTLVIVLSAARNDRLEAWTWTWPVVGRVPYKGFFQLEAAQREAQKLERAGLDTYLRPASAFSTLGWFNDPLLSTTLRADSVELVSTVIHEILHNTLFVRGHVDFNESLAEFVGYHGAEMFFRSRGDTLRASRAAARWQDELVLERFWQRLEERLSRVYGSSAPPRTILEERAVVFREAQDEMRGPLAEELRTISGKRLAERPLNNAVLLAQRVYGTGLDRFDRLLAQEGGDLKKMIADLKVKVALKDDPWEALGTP